MTEERVKIRTKKGRIITLRIAFLSPTHVGGVDKFGDHIILPLDHVDLMLPYNEVVDNE